MRPYVLVGDGGEDGRSSAGSHPSDDEHEYEEHGAAMVGGGAGHSFPHCLLVPIHRHFTAFHCRYQLVRVVHLPTLTASSSLALPLVP